MAKVAADPGLGGGAGGPSACRRTSLYRPIGESVRPPHASFHSGRGAEAGAISRETPVNWSGRRRGPGKPTSGRQVQVALPGRASRATAANLQEHARQHGRAAFTFTDHLGHTAAPGRSSGTSPSPNRYHGPQSPGAAHAD
ncbi:MAG: hypothetical protein IPM76_23255 [Chloroflexi bacterium]|nr:hypothetical protein [Chloroflexota bacterium]